MERLNLNQHYLDWITNIIGNIHGGTGIRKHYVIESIRHGIAKVNVATAIRQPYERKVEESVAAGQEAVYQAMLTVIRKDLEIENSIELLM